MNPWCCQEKRTTSAFRASAGADRRSAAAAADVDDGADGESDERDEDDDHKDDKVTTAADGQNYEDTEEKKVFVRFHLKEIMLQSTLSDKIKVVKII